MAEMLEVKVSDLIEMLSNPYPLRRRSALMAIGLAAVSDHPVELQFRVEDGAVYAEFFITEFGQDAVAPAVGPLTRMVHDTDPDVRATLAGTLRLLGDDAVWMLLACIADMTPRGRDTLLALAALANDEDPEVRSAVGIRDSPLRRSDSGERGNGAS